MWMPSRSFSSSLRWVWLAPWVSSASQVHYISNNHLGCGVGGLASPVAMGEGTRTLLPVSCQHAPCMARTDSHQLARLIQRNLLGQQAV